MWHCPLLCVTCRLLSSTLFDIFCILLVYLSFLFLLKYQIWICCNILYLFPVRDNFWRKILQLICVEEKSLNGYVDHVSAVAIWEGLGVTYVKLLLVSEYHTIIVIVILDNEVPASDRLVLQWQHATLPVAPKLKCGIAIIEVLVITWLLARTSLLWMPCHIVQLLWMQLLCDISPFWSHSELSSFLIFHLFTVVKNWIQTRSHTVQHMHTFCASLSHLG